MADGVMLISILQVLSRRQMLWMKDRISPTTRCYLHNPST